MGGYDGSFLSTLDYVTIATTGNATAFGSLTGAKFGGSGTSNSIRGVNGGGYTGSVIDTIDYITIATTGNGTVFGNLTSARSYLAACSDSHGGL
jgi:hypothetical protein